MNHLSHFFLAWLAVFVLIAVGHGPTVGTTSTLLLGVAIDLGGLWFRTRAERKV
jgi:hypothetical protein